VLKPPNEPASETAENVRPVGELVHELIEDGKAYARAEIAVVKATAVSKVQAFKLPAILFGLAYVLTLAAITALAVGVAMGLATLIGPLGGGVVAFLLFGGIAGALVWVGINKLREGL